MNGWVKIHRCALDHPQLKQNPVLRHILMDLVTAAAHKATTVYYRNKPVEIQRGQIMISYRGLAELTGYSLQQIRTATHTLQHSQTISINTDSNTGATVITLCNYDKFQGANDNPTQSAHTDQHGQQHSDQHINKKKKEINNNNISYTRAHARDPFGLNPYVEQSGYQTDLNGFAVLTGTVRQKWLDDFGGPEVLDAALIEISEQPIPPHSVERTIAARLARQLRLRAERQTDRTSRRPDRAAQSAKNNEEFQKMLEAI